MKRREFSFKFALPQPEFAFNWRGWLPSRGNVLFTLVMIAVLLWAQSAGAVPTRAENAASTGTIAYQGRLADSAGSPLTSTLNMSFRLYSAASGGTPLWTEQWTGSNGVKVSDGLFNVMLGSLTPIPQSVITGNANLFLGITVGTDDEMVPRVQLGSVPFAVQALSVPDGSITVEKLADGSITPTKAPKFVTGPADRTLVAHGQTTVHRSEGNSHGFSIIDLSQFQFTETPTVLCTTAGAFGHLWDCHVEHESAGSFYVFAVRRDGNADWLSTQVRWFAIGK